MANARVTAAKALLRTETSGAYSNILWNHTLQKAALFEQDKRFATTLYYGVLEQQILLNHLVDSYYSGKQALAKPVRVVLQIGFYQILSLDSVQDFAAVDESVKLVRTLGQPRAAGLVNAVLRNFLRKGKSLRLPDPQKHPDAHYALLYSYPQPLFELHKKDYGFDRAVAIAKASLGRPQVWLRVNTNKITASELQQKLNAEGMHAETSELFPDAALSVSHTDALEDSPSYRAGHFHVQDLSSQLCAAALSPKVGETVVDICAAPGGKTFTLAELMGDSGKVYSFDSQPKRVELIASGAKRLGLSSVIPKTVDGTKGLCELDGTADAILCDVPCGGLGVIRRKPEIRNKSLKELESLPPLQYKLLCRSAEYLCKGGRLVYSTCSLSKAENEEVVARFLAEHPNFSPLPLDFLSQPFTTNEHQLTLFPDNGLTDGFFIATMVRSK